MEKAGLRIKSEIPESSYTAISMLVISFKRFTLWSIILLSQNDLLVRSTYCVYRVYAWYIFAFLLFLSDLETIKISSTNICAWKSSEA